MFFFIAFGLFIFFGIYDRIVFDQWLGLEFSQKILSETDRGNFSVIYPVTFIVDLFIVVWLLGPGAEDRNPWIRRLAQGLHRFVTFRPFVFLGQHSLQVFSAHIVIVYVLEIIYQDGPPSELTGAMVICTSLALLFGVAWLHSLSVKRQKLLKAARPNVENA